MAICNKPSLTRVEAEVSGVNNSAVFSRPANDFLINLLTIVAVPRNYLTAARETTQRYRTHTHPPLFFNEL